MSIILGIDPGIADTGYGIIRKEEDGRLRCLGYGSIRTDSRHQMPKRLEKLYDDLYAKIEEHRPSLMAMEQLFFCKNVKTALTVGQARGAIMVIAQKKDLSLSEYTPLQIKQAVSTYGKASKEQVQKMVQFLLGLKEKPTPDDAADALAAAICASNSVKSYKVES